MEMKKLLFVVLFGLIGSVFQVDTIFGGKDCKGWRADCNTGEGSKPCCSPLKCQACTTSDGGFCCKFF